MHTHANCTNGVCRAASRPCMPRTWDHRDGCAHGRATGRHGCPGAGAPHATAALPWGRTTPLAYAPMQYRAIVPRECCAARQRMRHRRRAGEGAWTTGPGSMGSPAVGAPRVAASRSVAGACRMARLKGRHRSKGRWCANFTHPPYFECKYMQISNAKLNMKI